MTGHGLTCFDVFCGCGGFSCGMMQAGFEVLAGIDNDAVAIATYRTNLGDENTKIIGDIPKKDRKWFDKPAGWRYHLEGDDWVPPVRAVFIKNILDVSGWEMLDASNVESVDVMVGSPPCQSFSKINRRKKKNDCRDFMVFEYGRLIMEINPSSFVMENVPEIDKAKLPDGRNIIETFKKMVSDRDWDTYYDIQAMYPDEMWDRRDASAATSLNDFGKDVCKQAQPKYRCDYCFNPATV